MERNRSHAKIRKSPDEGKAHARPFEDVGDRLNQGGGEAGGEEIDGVITMLGEIDVESVESLADIQDEGVRLSGALQKLAEEDVGLSVQHDPVTHEILLLGQGDPHLRTPAGKGL